MPVGEPFELPVSFGDGDDCFCGEQLACAVEVRDGRIELTSQICEGPIPCDACFPFVEGRCAIPALEEGRYLVSVNGADSFELEASNVVPVVGPVDFCATIPEDRECGTFFTPVVRGVETLCFSEAPPGEPSLLHVTFTASCTELPTCEVRRTAHQLQLFLRTLEIGCPIDCGPGTFTVETTCVVPPLEAGEYQLVVWEGSFPLPLTIRPGAPSSDCTRP